MKLLIGIATLSVFIISCGKDKFNTKPTLTYKSINTKTLKQGEDLKIDLNVTDKEGDLTDTIFVFKRTRNCPSSFRNEKYKLPVFPTNTNLNVNIQIAYGYRSQSGLVPIQDPQCPNRNDSCVLKFVIKDKAGNLSDTISTPEFVILK